MEVKALNFEQLLKLSKVLKKMGFKINLIDFVFGDKFDKMLKEMESSPGDKANTIFINIIAFFIENMCLAKNEVYDLISDYTGKSILDIKEYTIDDLIPTIYNIVGGSLPKNLKVLVLMNVESYKKKVMEMLKNKQ